MRKTTALVIYIMCLCGTVAHAGVLKDPIPVSPDFPRAVEIIYPASSWLSWEVRDNGDGKGSYLVRWDLSDPIPTEAQVSSAISERAETKSETEKLKEKVETMAARLEALESK